MNAVYRVTLFYRNLDNRQQDHDTLTILTDSGPKAVRRALAMGDTALYCPPKGRWQLRAVKVACSNRQ